eukprot:CAMPEP_0113585104 /NCGR_PEP_ID=MMETSP0015_2-20120614/33494_1 /TAXON_ID=2838 /ORGANISM="Odontella" /LENGTH=39 /DNA_ID=CAMNT_0000490269 /DNA_START=153 /DNA_END=268 /DNA_ORIENTATION=- /assembly_acc=CAM_ASM_000160
MTSHHQQQSYDDPFASISIPAASPSPSNKFDLQQRREAL